MTYSYNQIQQHAAKLLKKFDISQAPVDVIDIANRMGINVVFEPLEENVSGVLVIHDTQAAIGVNENQHRHRQRFTIAHELGHYVLHRNNASIFVDTIQTFYRDHASSDGTAKQEIEANAFAAELLMPESMIKSYISKYMMDLNDEDAISQLSAKYGVSEQALTIRLVRLKLIQLTEFSQT